MLKERQLRITNWENTLKSPELQLRCTAFENMPTKKSEGVTQVELNPAKVLPA